MLGKYAEFIVPAFAITALVFGVMTAWILAQARHWRRRYEDVKRNDPGYH
ncbi:heme exporter protein CcmD [Phenylobacterium sp.]|jgi:heme exporter protein CcmD